MVGRSGPRRPLVIAGVCFFVACAMLVGIGPTTPFAWLIAAYVVFGIGFGFVNAPITNAAVSGMPRAQAGVAAAIATTSRQFGQAIGVAIVGAIVASGAGGSTGAGPPSATPRRAGGRSPRWARWCSCSGCWRPAAGDRGRRGAPPAALNPEALAA